MDNVDIVSHKVCQKDPFSLSIGRELVSNFADILASKLVFLTRGCDRLIWCPSKSCVYSVKSGYEALLGMFEHHVVQ